ncbi:MAG TPA: hypothetical protein DCM87_03895 [Planctomycetes bacterium]|nr:hypothetical protein [Planctomycetota bacterium]
MRRLAVAFVGEVDHGKSTLIGRLLLESGSLSLRKEEAVRSGALDLAHVTDQLGREQDECCTVTAAQAFLRSGGREIALVDAPGHEEFIRSMLTGASIADAAVILVDAAEGVREETRRHALLVKLLRIPQAAVVVNKIDKAPSAEAAYAALAREIGALAAEIGLPLGAVVPASARSGVMVASRGGALPWYAGPTVLEAILAFKEPDAAGGPARFSVQDVYDFTPRKVAAGRVERGELAAGDRLVVVPGGAAVTVERIPVFPDGALERLPAGCAGALELDRPERVRRGHVLAPAADAPRASREVRGRVFCLGPQALAAGARYIFRLATQDLRARVAAIEERFDTGVLAPRAPEGTLAPLELGLLALELDGECVTEDGNLSPALGRFVLEDEAGPVAFGMVVPWRASS